MAKKSEEIFSLMANYGILPKIAPEDALSSAKALKAGGLKIAELAFGNDGAKTMAALEAALPDMAILAGDVFTPEQASEAIRAGAKAIVTPGFEGANALDIPVILECSSEDELQRALDAGGIGAIKFLAEKTNLAEFAARHPKTKFIAFGDTKNDNIVSLLSEKSVIACGAEAGPSGEPAVGLVQKMLGFDLGHVVINCENAEQAEREASRVESIFGFLKTDSGSSFSNADILHFTKSKSYGKNGQVAISTNFIERAVFYLKAAGRQFIEESARFDDDGKLASIYLDNIISGFAFKLVRR